MGAAFVLKVFLGIVLAILFLWVGLTGRPGSLLAAVIMPDALSEK